MLFVFIAPAIQPTTQNPVPSIQIPHAAADILQLASEMNGLDVPSAKPWHLKFSYDQFDDDGDNIHSGTVEEFYVGHKKWKRIFASDTLKQADVATDTGLYRSGDQRWLNWVEELVITTVLRPLDAKQWEREPHRTEKKDQKIGDTRLSCVHIQRTERNFVFSGPDFCFAPETVMLRYIRRNLTEQVTFNEIVPFQGHYLAKEIAVTQSGKPYLKIHVEDIGEITKANDSFFVPPPDGVGPLGGRIVLLSFTFMEDYLISSSDPVYPTGANGLVHVRFVVGKDGHVIEASALDGPEKLRKPILEAVRKYRFRPFLILDQPVEVESRMEFDIHSR